MTSLLHLDISDTDVTEIPEKAFNSITSHLMSIKLPKGLKKIGNNAFNGCTLINSLDLTEAVSLLSINSNAFDGCTSLEKVKFSESLKSIDNYAFNNCNKLSRLAFPTSLETIGYSAFKKCIGLTSIDFSKYTALGSISSAAFSDCTGLSILDLSACEALTSINSSAFMNCTSLGTINFPSSLASIGGSAFANCTNLLQLSVPCIVPPVIANNSEPFTGVDNIACVLSIPTDSFFDYYSANYWGGFVDVENKGEIQNIVSNPTDDENNEDDNLGNTNGNKNTDKGCHIHFKKHQNGGNAPRLISTKGVKTLATSTNIIETSEMGVTGDGQSIFTSYGESVTFYLTPEEGKEIKSVKFNEEDVTAQLVNNTYTTTLTNDMYISYFEVELKNASPLVLGDVNGDGTVDVSDVMALANYVLAKNVEGFNVAVADVNEDGDIDVSDVMKLANIILNK